MVLSPPRRGEPLGERAITHRDAFHARYGTPDKLAVTLVVECVGRVIGDLMIRVGDAWGQDEIVDRARATQAELAWCLDPAQAGHGYATEAVREQVRLCFEELGLRRVVAHCFAANEPSWRLMECVGMRRESHLVRDSLHRSGQWHDSLGYALIAGE